jgi:hypothetical protein
MDTTEGCPDSGLRRSKITPQKDAVGMDGTACRIGRTFGRKLAAFGRLAIGIQTGSRVVGHTTGTTGWLANNLGINTISFDNLGETKEKEKEEKEEGFTEH